MSRQHTVQQGECLQSIALAYGFRDFRALYDHPDNAPLRKRRPNPNVLHPGDRVVVPDKEAKTTTVPTSAEHTFVVRRPRRALHLVFRDDEGEAFANVPFELRGPGVEHRGTTGADGSLHVELPLDTPHAEVSIFGIVKRLELAHLDPTWDDDEDRPIVAGIQARLANLGYDPGPVDGLLGPRTTRAIRAFEIDRAMTPTGHVSRALASRLGSDHGC